MTRCKECNALIEFITTESGKKMPVNPEQIPLIPDGLSKMIGISADGKIIRGQLTMQGTPGAVLVQISHFSTCAAADKLRKAKKKQ